MKKSLLLIVSAILASVTFSSAFAANKAAAYISAQCPATYEGKKLFDVDFQFGYPKDPQLNFVLCNYGSPSDDVSGPYYADATAFSLNATTKIFVSGNWKRETSNSADCATNGNPADCSFLKKLA